MALTEILKLLRQSGNFMRCKIQFFPRPGFREEAVRIPHQ